MFGRGTSCSIAPPHGRSIKWLSIIDEYTRECLALEVDRTMTSENVLDVLRDLGGDSWRAEAHPQRQWPGVYCRGDSPVSVVGGGGPAVHRTGFTVAERLCGELPQSAAERAARRRDLRECA